MAISEGGMFGSHKGKVGKLVFYVRKGKQVVRVIGKNNTAPSPKQLKNRMEMKVANQFCKSMIPFIKFGFAQQIVGTDLSQSNVAVSYTKLNALKGEYPDISVDYEKVKLSAGPLIEAGQATVTLEEDGIRFNWYTGPEIKWPDNTDQVMMMAYIPEEKRAVYQLFGAARSAGQDLLPLSAQWLQGHIETYILSRPTGPRFQTVYTQAVSINQKTFSTMGILRNGILGGVSNKVGPVVGRRRRGQDVLTGPYRISTKKKTPDQLAQNDRFSMLSSFLSQVQELVGVGFKKFTKKRSAFNSAFAYNYEHAFIQEADVIKINYPKMVYSRGPVDIANCPAITISGHTLTFTWALEAENQLNRHSDEATFFVYSADLKDASYYRNAAKRSDLTYTVELKEGLPGTNLHCYMSFQNESGKLVGDSRYVGLV